MSNRVCRCGKGFASAQDNMCSKCREKLHASTRRELNLFGIKRGDGISFDNYKAALAKADGE